MADYWANYRVTWRKDDPSSPHGTKIVTSWYDSFPVIGIREEEAAILDVDGKVRTVSELLAEYREGDNERDEHGRWANTTLEVVTADLSALDE